VEKPFGIREWQARNRRVSYTQMAKELQYRLIMINLVLKWRMD